MSESGKSDPRIDLLLAPVREVLGVHGRPVALHEPFIPAGAWDSVKDCLDTGWVSSVGRYVTEFEERIAAVTGCAAAVATVNGTAALHLSLIAVGVEAGDEVIVPSLTFVATANAIGYCGATPHFVDVDESSLGLCATSLRERLERVVERRTDGVYNRETGARIRAVLCVHGFGHPADMTPLVAVCEEYGLALVEDAAESLGSSYAGQHTGTFGATGAMSFNGNKTMTTGGGGMVLTNDLTLAKRIRHISTTAKRAHPWEYWHDEVGFNYRLSNLNAALGCAGLDELETILSAKRALAERYLSAFEGHSHGRVFREQEGAKSSYWLNLLLLNEPDATLRDGILAAAHEQQVLMRPAWVPLHLLPIYADAPRGEMSTTENLHARILCLPSSVSLGIAH